MRSHPAFGLLRPLLNRKILNVALLRLRFCSILATKSASKSGAISKRPIYGQAFLLIFSRVAVPPDRLPATFGGAAVPPDRLPATFGGGHQGRRGATSLAFKKRFGCSFERNVVLPGPWPKIRVNLIFSFRFRSPYFPNRPLAAIRPPKNSF